MCHDCNDNLIPNPCQDPCKPQETCGCLVKQEDHCVTLSEDMECVDMPRGTKLSAALKAIDNYLCRLKEDIGNVTTFIIKNVGEGVKVFKGISITGKREFRSLVSLDTETLEIGEEENEITFKVNTREFQNLGSGSEVYKGVGTNGNRQFKTLISSDNNLEIEETEDEIVFSVGDISPLEVTDMSCEAGFSLFEVNTPNEKGIRGIRSQTLYIEESEGCLNIELAQEGGVPRYIVNNSYTGVEELGTESKPFKNIQNALTKFVGTGTNVNPQNSGAFILIQKGSGTYTHSTGLLYRNLSIIQQEGSEVNYTQSGFLVDFDILYPGGNDQRSYFDYQVSKSAILRITQGSGFRNRGSDGSTARAKTIKIFGEGEINLSGSTHDSGRVLYSSNVLGASGYVQPQFSQIEVTGVESSSLQNRIIEMGRGSNISFLGGVVTSGQPTTQMIATEIEAIKMLGGILTFNQVKFRAQGVSRYRFITLYQDNELDTTKLRVYDCLSEYPNQVANYFERRNGGQPEIDIISFKCMGGGIERVFSSHIGEGVWLGVNSKYGQYIAGIIATPSEVDLTQGVKKVGTINALNNHLIESLPTYLNRGAASILPEGSKFINQNDSTDKRLWSIDIVM